MATVGNYASSLLKASMGVANYTNTYGANSSMWNSIASKSNAVAKSSKSGSLDQLNGIINNRLKGKSDAYISTFTDLYKSIYGIKDDSDKGSTTTNPASLRSAGTSLYRSANSLTQYAKNLKYGADYNEEDYKKAAQSFIDDYNNMIDQLGNSDNNKALQKGVILVNSSQIYSSALERAGITRGSDNKLTLSDDLSKVTASTIKTTFGISGFSEKTATKAQQISAVAGTGFTFPTYNSSGLTNYAYSTGALFSIYA